MSRTGLGHKLLARILRCACILDKYFRNLQFQYRLSVFCFVPPKILGNLLRSSTHSLLTRLDCFASLWVGKTCLRLSSPDASQAVGLLPGHDKSRLSSAFSVSRTGLEPARDNSHYPLKVARLPVPPPGHIASASPAIMHKSHVPCNVIHQSIAAGRRYARAQPRAHQHEKRR